MNKEHSKFSRFYKAGRSGFPFYFEIDSGTSCHGLLRHVRCWSYFPLKPQMLPLSYPPCSSHMDFSFKIFPALAPFHKLFPMARPQIPLALSICNNLLTSSLVHGPSLLLEWKPCDTQGPYFSSYYTDTWPRTDAQHITVTQYMLSDGATTSPSVRFILYSLFRPHCIVRTPRYGEDHTVASIPSQMKRSVGETRGNGMRGKNKPASYIHFFFLFACPSPFHLLHKCTNKVRLCVARERRRFRTALEVQVRFRAKVWP